MLRGLYRLFAGASDWHPREMLIGAIAAEMVAVLVIVSLGFATAAAYIALGASFGPAMAALLLSGAFAVAALLGGVGLWRWRAAAARRDAAARDAAAQGSQAQMLALLQSVAAAGSPQGAATLAAALEIGRALSPMERLVAALVGGFMAGRKLGR